MSGERLRDESGRFRKYTCESCNETFEKDEARDLFKGFELLEDLLSVPNAGQKPPFGEVTR